MPPRPAGTDGTDHSYREVIADRYRRMADYKDSIEKLMFLHGGFLLLKLGWHYTAFSLEGIPLPLSVLGMVGGQVLVLAAYSSSKLGTVKERLPVLKAFNILQACVTATEVLSAWQYHQGTATDGVPTYHNSVAVAKHLAARLPSQNPESLLGALKALELFLDLTLTAFLVMATFVAHKMIVEKMEMKKEKVSTDRRGAQKGGGDSDSDDDSDGVPAAVPLAAEDRPASKVARAAAASKGGAVRRRHA